MSWTGRRYCTHVTFLSDHDWLLITEHARLELKKIRDFFGRNFGKNYLILRERNLTNKILQKQPLNFNNFVSFFIYTGQKKYKWLGIYGWEIIIEIWLTMTSKNTFKKMKNTGFFNYKSVKFYYFILSSDLWAVSRCAYFVIAH